jgi:hypothetical protein
MNRERVIVDIDSLGQALKVEQTIRTGYCEPIAENILQWIAVEEDLANSYHKIVDKSENPELKKALIELEEESRRNTELLHSLLKSDENLREARLQREKLVEHLLESS